MADLNTNVRYLKGIGEQRANALEKLGINTLQQLVSYFPRSYEDRSSTVPIALLADSQSVCVRALVATAPNLTRVRRGMELVKFKVVDDSGSMDITYFNQSYVRQQLKVGESYIFYGKITLQGLHCSMSNPVFEAENGPKVVTGRIVPIYSLTSGISQKMLIGAIRRGLDECANLMPDVLPPAISQRAELVKAPYAFENIHFPSDLGALELARRRLIFEELFVLSCALTRMKNTRVKKRGILITSHGADEFYSKLPFIATGAQVRAIADSLRDLGSGNSMNRLIQGDVGSGKTLVAAACIWAVSQAGLQTAFMAPTEILVNQHHTTLTELLAPFNIRVSKLTGSMTAKEKRQALADLKSGETQLIVGTHALISEAVEFDALALVITDEQHRFGVNQRAALIAKGQHPHTFVMSATPIPRTLALMIYGDLDVSIIDELPPGRQKVETFVLDEDMRPRINKFVRKQVDTGRQVFIVCPVIDENEDAALGLKSAKEFSAQLQKEVFPDLTLACIHGKMKAAEKDKIMAAFVAGEISILVSTTVIEVGVDIPNASLMIVENADRFGLSQLHQLRGRVGRGTHKSYCVLFSDTKNPDTKARLSIMGKTNDGFKISEEDLKLRGPGDFFGARQHGLPQMNIADLCTDMGVLKAAQAAAQELLSRDPDLSRSENQKLKNHINQLFEQSTAIMN